jgi:hypothetical protein
VTFTVEGARAGELILLTGWKPCIWSIFTLSCGISVLVCILQPHYGKGSSCQFLINKEHESSSEDCLKQFGLKAFVESHDSKTPKRKKVGKKQVFFVKVNSCIREIGYPDSFFDSFTLGSNTMEILNFNTDFCCQSTS